MPIDCNMAKLHNVCNMSCGYVKKYCMTSNYSLQYLFIRKNNLNFARNNI